MSVASSTRTDRRSSAVLEIIWWLFRCLVSLFFVAVTVAAFYNVFGVGPEVEVLAKEKACQGQPLPCSAQYTLQMRLPWEHSFDMRTALDKRPVTCRRQYIFAGDWACHVKGESTELVPTVSARPNVKPPPRATTRPTTLPHSAVPIASSTAASAASVAPTASVASGPNLAPNLAPTNP